MTGEYDRISGRYEAVSPPIIVSLGIGYDPDPLTESWQIEFVEPPAESTSGLRARGRDVFIGEVRHLHVLHERAGFEVLFSVSPDGQRFLMARHVGKEQSGARFVLVNNFGEVLKERVSN